MIFKLLVTLVLNICDKDLLEVSILENDAAFSYALLFFLLAALHNLFNTIKFRKQALPSTDKPAQISSPSNQGLKWSAGKLPCR